MKAPYGGGSRRRPLHSAATGKELKGLSATLILPDLSPCSNWERIESPCRSPCTCIKFKAATGKELKAFTHEQVASPMGGAATGKELKAEPGPDEEDGAEDEDCSNWERIERWRLSLTMFTPCCSSWAGAATGKELKEPEVQLRHLRCARRGSNWERIESHKPLQHPPRLLLQHAATGKELKA